MFSPKSPIPFHLWILDNQDDLRREFDTMETPKPLYPGKCGECHGKGYQECDLGHEHDCEECDGSGNAPDRCENFMTSEYLAAVNHDKQKYARYVVNLERESCLTS